MPFQKFRQALRIRYVSFFRGDPRLCLHLRRVTHDGRNGVITVGEFGQEARPDITGCADECNFYKRFEPVSN